jgi:hypothetical protein
MKTPPDNSALLERKRHARKMAAAIVATTFLLLAGIGSPASPGLLFGGERPVYRLLAELLISVLIASVYYEIRVRRRDRDEPPGQE